MMLNNVMLSSDIELSTGRRQSSQKQLAGAAAAAYRRLRLRAGAAKLWAMLTGRGCRLLHLDTVLSDCTVRGSHYAGLRTVSLKRVRGSEGRCEDFDAEFRPLKAHNRSRWQMLAVAVLKGTVLPPVELAQVGDVYFVRDGHHRISIARAFGQESIEAEVTVWDVAKPLPWDLSTPASGAVFQAT